MLKSKVNAFLGKNVILKTFGGSVYTGMFQKYDDKTRGYYHCIGSKTNHLYRSSHIKIIKEVE